MNGLLRRGRGGAGGTATTAAGSFHHGAPESPAPSSAEAWGSTRLLRTATETAIRILLVPPFAHGLEPLLFYV